MQPISLCLPRNNSIGILCISTKATSYLQILEKTLRIRKSNTLKHCKTYRNNKIGNNFEVLYATKLVCLNLGKYLLEYLSAYNYLVISNY